MRRMEFWCRIMVLACLWTAGTARIIGQEWTRFRGPNGTGISHAVGIPSQWGQKDYVWRLKLPGSGHASPVLWGKKLFTTGASEGARAFEVYRVDTDSGRLAWRHEFPLHPYSKHRFNSFASSTPVVTADRVFVCWSVPEAFQVAALDHEGRLLWERDLGPYKSQHGGGTSPIIWQDHLILANDQMGESFVLALDPNTGETLWQTERASSRAAYSTPCLWEDAAGNPHLIVNSQAEGITAMDPRTGKRIWSHRDSFDMRSVSSPFFGKGLIFGSCGSGAGGDYLIAVKPPAATSGGAPTRAFRIRRAAPYVPTGLTYGDRLYLWDDAPLVSCYALSSGELIWQERISGTRFFGSPVWIDGRLFCISDTGEVVVVRAADTFEELGNNPLGEESRATPAVANQQIYLRTLQHVVCIGSTAPRAAPNDEPDRRY